MLAVKKRNILEGHIYVGYPLLKDLCEKGELKSVMVSKDITPLERNLPNP